MYNQWKSLLLIVYFFLPAAIFAGIDPLPSWNEGQAKSKIISFVKQSSDASSPNYVPPESRIAVFDQDGTICVEHPLYIQLVYILEQAKRGEGPFFGKAVEALIQSGKESDFTFSNLETLFFSPPKPRFIQQSREEIKTWLSTARHPRWKKRYTQLVYQPMKEVVQYFQNNGYKIYVASAGGQEFVRIFSHDLIGVSPECVSAMAFGTELVNNGEKKGDLATRDFPLFNAHTPRGKAEALYFMLGQMPLAAFGNSSEDRYMLEYANSGEGKRLIMLILHDDKDREYAYGPARGLPDTLVGRFPQSLYDQAMQSGWTIISMKNDWKKIFSFDN